MEVARSASSITLRFLSLYMSDRPVSDIRSMLLSLIFRLFTVTRQTFHKAIFQNEGLEYQSRISIAKLGISIDEDDKANVFC